MRYFILILLLVQSTLLIAQEWQPDFDVALEKAQSANKPLLLVFSGSDWCAPCIKLDQRIWQSKEFVDYSESNYLLYKADFPRKKSNKLNLTLQERNEELAELYNPRGYFPLVVVLNGEGKVLGEAGYTSLKATEYIEKLNGFLK